MKFLRIVVILEARDGFGFAIRRGWFPAVRPSTFSGSDGQYLRVKLRAVTRKRDTYCDAPVAHTHLRPLLSASTYDPGQTAQPGTNAVLRVSDIPKYTQDNETRYMHDVY